MNLTVKCKLYNSEQHYDTNAYDTSADTLSDKFNAAVLLLLFVQYCS